MAKNYFYIILLLAFFFTTLTASAQDTSKQLPKPQDGTTIEGLSMYPNPVTNGKVYITSKNDLEKEIVVFDLLGKKLSRRI